MCLCFLFLAYSQRSLISPLPQPEHEIEALARCDGCHIVSEIAWVDRGEAGALRDDEAAVVSTTRKGELGASEVATKGIVDSDCRVVHVLRRRLDVLAAWRRAVLPECGAVAVRICDAVPQQECMAVVGVDAYTWVELVDGGDEHSVHDRRGERR